MASNNISFNDNGINNNNNNREPVNAPIAARFGLDNIIRNNDLQDAFVNRPLDNNFWIETGAHVVVFDTNNVRIHDYTHNREEMIIRIQIDELNLTITGADGQVLHPL